MTQVSGSASAESKIHFKGMRRVVKGGIRLGARWFRGSVLAGWDGGTVEYAYFGGDRATVWVDDAYLGEILAEDAPFFLRHRFGEVNQIGGEDCHDKRSFLNGFLHIDIDEGHIGYELDYYSEGRVFTPDTFDGERWEDEKRTGDAPLSKEGWKDLYRVARSLKKGRHITFLKQPDGAGDHTLLAFGHPALGGVA
jgi:hypothetical protein